MRDKLVLRFLGFLETMKYILEQSHGVPPVSVALDHTTLKEEGSCGYSSVKTVRSIVLVDECRRGGCPPPGYRGVCHTRGCHCRAEDRDGTPVPRVCSGSLSIRDSIART